MGSFNEEDDRIVGCIDPASLAEACAHLAMHGAGSPQAQRIVMMGQAGIEAKIKMAEAVIDGKDDVPGLPLRRG